MDNKCLVCGNGTFQRSFDILDKCTECGFITFNGQISFADLNRLYNHDYFNGGEYCDYVSDRETIEKNFLLRLKVLDKYLKPGLHNKLFEIGSAYGFFLHTAAARFSRVAGIDITREGCRFARENLGLEVADEDYLHYQPTFQPDVICMWDTIEHLPRPDQFISKINQELAPSGLLCLTTGDIDSLNARLRGKKWRLIHPPTHLHYFSPKTITMMLEKNGFKVIHIEHCGFYRSLKLVLYYLLVIQKRNPHLYALLERLGVNQLSFYLNLYDIMYVIAEKVRC